MAAPTAEDPKPDNPLEQPMRFTIVRSDAGSCEPNCPEWIYGEGQIEASTPAAFRKVLAVAGKRQLPLMLLSPGGNVNAAMEIGRLVRARKMDVTVGATRFLACRNREEDCLKAIAGDNRGSVVVAGAFCWSACPLVLAGGMRRLSSEWSFTGVHQITTVYRRQKVTYRESYRIINGEKKMVSRKIISRKDAGTQVSTRLPKATKKKLTAYFKEMGIRKTLLEAMLSTPPDKIRRLEPEELLTLGLITEITTIDPLTDPVGCAAETPLPNCVFRLGTSSLSKQAGNGRL
jgi:hypothetical protein